MSKRKSVLFPIKTNGSPFLFFCKALDAQFPECEPFNEAAHIVEIILFWAGVSILGIFAVELLCLLVAFREYFFTRIFYVVDLVIVGGSLALEIRFSDKKELADLLAVLIVVRCWRFVRIVHGIVASVKERQAEEIAEIKKLALQKDLLKGHLVYVCARKMQLEHILDKNGVERLNKGEKMEPGVLTYEDMERLKEVNEEYDTNFEKGLIGKGIEGKTIDLTDDEEKK